ncbi:hypothetical protein ACFL06_01375 [Patescibacteria group bacterium]
MLKLNNKKILLIPSLLIGLMFFTVLPLTVQALFEDSKGNIYIGPDEVIEHNFIQGGGIIDFDGQAQKDVIVAGGTITISGPVEGDVIAAGGTVKIKGEVKGNVRVTGGIIEIDSKVGKNVNVFGGTVVIGPDAEIGWDVLMGSGTVEIRGKVGGNIKGGASSIIIANEVGGDVDLKLSSEDGQLILYPQAVIQGDLTYTAPETAEVKEGAIITGETLYKPTVPPVTPLKEGFGISYLVGKILGLLSLLVVGLVIILLARRKSREIGERMLDKPLVSFGWGLVYFIITPIVLVLVAITVIGIPIALIVFVSYIIALYLTKVFIGIALGQKVLRWWSKKQEVSLIWALVLGVVLFSILTSLPTIGWIIGFVGICWALGAMVQVKKQTLKQIEG